MRSYKLHLIRHGITQGNAEKRYIGGGTDEPLSKQGRIDLMALLEKYNYPTVDKVYTSPMIRAIESCEILYEGYEYTIVDNVTECNFGEFENETFEKLSQNERFAKWLDRSEGFVPTGAESNQEFAQRVAEGLNEIFIDMMKNGIYEAACVCHGGVIAMLLGMFCYPQKPFHEWTSNSGCGFTIMTNTELWTRDNVIEAIQIIPYDLGEK